MVPLGSVSAARSSFATVATSSLAASFDSAGIPLVTNIMQPRPKSESQAQAVSDAQVFAEEHPDSVGYPWLDRETGTVELSATNEQARALLDGEAVALKAAGGAGVNFTVRNAESSVAQLMAISDDITALQQQGVPDADFIYLTAPDFQTNRIVIRVSAASTELFATLARRYGTAAIAVWIDPSPHDASTLSRDNDVPDFYGGAKIGTPGNSCSDAFSWTTASTKGNALLTAAHCIPSGGNVTIGTSSTVRGTVTASSEENWDATYGTRYYSGQATYRGDVALIRLSSAYRSVSEIYRGGPTSSTHSNVATRLLRFSYPDENVYVGGARTGETGPYHINFVNVNVWYNLDGPNVIARNVTTAYLLNSGTVVDHGDSGGSVFRVDGSGGIIAVGVHSGKIGDSTAAFTDIYHSFLALPGDVNLN